jgi:multiple sugar transport system permease protein
MLLVTAYPILQAIYESLFDFRLTDPDNRSFTGCRTTTVVLTDRIWWISLGVTLFITVVTVAVELVLGFALALVMVKALSSIRPVIRPRSSSRTPSSRSVSAFAWQYAFSLTSGFVNAWFSWVPGIGADTDWFGGQWSALFVVCIAEIWKTTPFISLLLLAGLAQVPEVLQEAARVDGATWWQRMTKVTIPNMKAAIMVALLFRQPGRLPRLRQHLRDDRRREQHRDVSFLAYRQTISRPGDRARLGRVGAAVPLRRDHLRDLHQGLQGRPVGLDGRQVDVDEGAQPLDRRGHRHRDLRAVPDRVDRLAVVQEGQRAEQQELPADQPSLENYQFILTGPAATCSCRRCATRSASC